MAVYHSSYLFKPEGLAAALIPFLNATKEPAIFSRLHERVLSLLDSNSEVRRLADLYGSWDRKTIAEMRLPAARDVDRDTGFLFVFILYGQLSDVNPALGLSERFDLLDMALSALAWDATSRRNLIYGRGFADFARRWIYGTSNSPDIENGLDAWQHIHPGSTAGSLGWLSQEDVSMFLARLDECGPKLRDLRLGEDFNVISDIYNAARRMLLIAQQRGSGLCMVVSG